MTNKRVLSANEIYCLQSLIEQYLRQQRAGENGSPIRCYPRKGEELTCPILSPEKAQKPIATNLPEAIRIAVASRCHQGRIVAPDPHDRRSKWNCHSHQRHVRISVYPKLTDSLLERENDIFEARSFDAIYRIVATAANNITGAGEVMVYDVALRLGLWRGDHSTPQHVYLHADPLAAAKAILGKINSNIIDKKEFPEPFWQLSAAQIENFLCVYKESINKCLRSKGAIA